MSDNNRTTHMFTFGQSHMSSFPLPKKGGRLADYWVEVDIPRSHPFDHRSVFIEHFTEEYCPRPMQWNVEYTSSAFQKEYFTGGCLCKINEFGIIEEEKDDKHSG